MTQLPGFDPGFSTAETTRIFSPAAKIAAMCRVETALANAEDVAGMLPSGVAAEIGDVCDGFDAEPSQILAEGWELGSPVIVLLNRLRALMSEEAAAWIHHGASTQDIVDTSAVLLIGEALGSIDKGLVEVIQLLRDLAIGHRATPAPARTLLQDAGPITFGLRAAQWLSPVVGHVEALRAISSSLPVQLGDSNGANATLGDRTAEVTSNLASELGLAVPLLPWHSDRSPTQQAVGLAQRLALTMGKTATDLTLLAQSAIGEVRMRPGGSSSMSWKRNPIDAIRAIAASEVCLANSQLIVAGRPQELERGAGGWHAEWFALPVVFQTCAASVEAVLACLSSLEIDGGRMAANLACQPGEANQTAIDTHIDRVVAAADALSPRRD